MRAGQNIAAAAAAFTLTLTGASSANDGFLGLPAGGLTLQQSAEIRMVEEDLFLSLKEVRVSYVFRNEGAEDLTVEVGFPMPGVPAGINFAAPTDGYDLSEVTGLDVLAFSTQVDGVAVTPRPVVRAYLWPADVAWDRRDVFRFTDALDVTDELTAAGVPLDFDAQAIAAAFAALPPETQADWQARGLYIRDGSFERPEWWLSTVFVRTQMFPAGRDVRVAHRYTPYPSGFIMPVEYFDHVPELAEAVCLDGPTRAGFRRLFTLDLPMAIGREIDYVLTTARSWKGPIGRFRLTIDKGAPGNIVSLCIDGITKTGPTTFVHEARDLVPERDLKVLIVEKPLPPAE